MRVKKQTITHVCSKCGKEFEVTGSIRISTSNPWHLYNKSKRPWRNCEHMRLCEKHFKEFDQLLRSLIYTF